MLKTNCLLLIPVLLYQLIASAHATTLRRAQSVAHEFDFEYRLFFDATDADSALSAFGSAVSDDLVAYYDKLNANVAVQNVASVSRGNCDADDLQEDAAAGYTNCVKAYSTISLLASENIDSVILQRSTLLRVRAFVSDPNSMASLSTLYDYPKLVQSSVLLRLVGQAVAMDDDEQFLFLQTFQEGFQPILEGDSYEWIEAKIIAQQAGTATPDLTIEESDKGDLYNRVELMMRAQCSGNACTDENFGNWLTQNVKAYAHEFLGRLFTVGPAEKDMYYDELRSIDVGESLLIEPLNPPKLTDTTNSEPSDAEMPAWLWAVLVAAVALLAFAVAWTCMRVGARKGAEMRRNLTGKQSKSFHGSQADGGSSVRGNSVASGSKHEVENDTPGEPEEERI